MNTLTTPTPTPTTPRFAPSIRLSWKELMALRQDYLGGVAQLQNQHPDIAQVRVFGQRVTHVFNPEWIREVLVDQSPSLIRWERLTHVFSLSMGQSVLVTEGQQWQRQRRMLQPGFAPKRIAGYCALMVQATESALGQISRYKSGPAMDLVDMEPLLTDLTLDVISRTLFGDFQPATAKGLAPAIQALSHFAYTTLFMPFTPPMWLPLPSVRKAKQALAVLNAYITTHIARHHNAVPQPLNSTDLLGMMRAARDPEQPDQGLSAHELHDQAMVMFLAGHETTAATMTWWCGLMARHSEVAKRIQEEVNTVLQGQAPTPEAIAQMPWLQASIKESLRLYPPALLMTRRALTDMQAGPYTVRKGELLALTPHTVHRDPRWYESPNEFKPQRFLPGAPEIPRGAWIPFGTGPRVCMGQHFAMLEMAIVAAMMLQRFTFVWPTDTPWPHAKMTVSLRPEKGMKLILEPRQGIG